MVQAMELIIKLLDVIAWPIVAVIVVFSLKSEIKGIIPLIKRLKIGPLEADFEQKVLNTSEKYEPSLDSITVESDDFPTEENLSRLVSINPRGAIMEAWLELEKSLKQAVVHKAGSPVPDVSTSYKIVQALRAQNIFNEEEVDLINELRGLRNQAAHLSEFHPTEASAFMFMQMAKKLESRAKSIASGGTNA